MKITINILALATVMAFGLINTASAITSEPSMAPTNPAPAVTDTEYVIEPDDVLAIAVFNTGPVNVGVNQATVLPDGTVSLPLIGSVSVSGKTTSQVQKLLTEKWSEQFVHPSVNVSVTTKHPMEVLVTGYVTHPGPTPFRLRMKVLDAIAEVGGALPNGDLAKTVVTHKDGGKEPVDLSDPETKSDSPANMMVKVGDLVFVPDRQMEITVLGQVNKPGSYPYTDNMTVSDAITVAGGITTSADLADATLTHDGKDQPLDLQSLLGKGDMSFNVKLASGDRISIPEGNRTYVFGEVAHPGFYYYKPGDRLLDAVTAVGGPTSVADLGKVNVITPSKISGEKPDFRRVDVAKYLKKGDITGNEILGPGEVLYIPKQHVSISFTDIIGTLSGLNLMNNILNGPRGNQGLFH